MTRNFLITLFVFLIAPLHAQDFWPDSAVIIGDTHAWFPLGHTNGNRVSVRDSEGNIHAVYSYWWHVSPHDSSEILYVFSTDNGLSWSEPENLSRTDSLISVDPNLVIDSQDRLHCVWKQYYDDTTTPSLDYDLYHSQKDGSGWTQGVNISNQHWGVDACYSSMVVDSRDYVHVVWDMSTGPGNWDIFYSFYNDTIWSTPHQLSDSPYDDALPALAIDSDDELYVGWRQRVTGCPLWYTHYNGDFWTEPEVFATNPDGGGGLCFVVDSEDRLHAIWNCGDIYYSIFNYTFWTKPLIISNTDVYASFASMAIDTLDNLYVVWEGDPPDSKREIYYRTYNGTQWSEIMNISQDTISSYGPKLGNPVSRHGVDLCWMAPDWEHNIRVVLYMKLSLIGIGEVDKSVITSVNLQTLPNPFKNRVTIIYNLPASSPLSLSIYDATGRLIDIINQGSHQAVNQRIVWQPDNLPPGVYFVRLETPDFIETEKVILLK